MADGRSGAATELSITGATFGREDGLGAVSVNFDPSTFDVTSGGLMRTQNAGQVAVNGSFSVLETDNTNAGLLGKNGARTTLSYNDGVTQVIDAAQVILSVSESGESRGAVRFNVDFMVDGPLS